MTERILGLTLDELSAKRRELICQAIVAPGELVALTWWCRIIGHLPFAGGRGEIVGTAYWLDLGAGRAGSPDLRSPIPFENDARRRNVNVHTRWQHWQRNRHCVDSI